MTEITSKLSTALADRYKIEHRVDVSLSMRRLMGLAAIPLIASLCLGCSSAAEDPDRSSTMTILADHSDKTINRYQTKFLLWLPLASGPEWADEFEARRRLAESWEHSPDYRTWTYHLRDDVRWHDGVPVTAHDVAFSLDLFGHPDVLFAAGGGLASLIDSMSVPDDHTLTLALTMPAYLGGMGWTVYFPRHLLQDLDPADFYEWDFWTRPVGNGPYRFVRHVPKTVLELESNPDFYAGEPAIKRVLVKFSSANPVIELTSGTVDVASNIGPTAVYRFRADPRFVVYHRYDWSELQLIYWNQRHPLFAEAAVRLALSHAIDRRGIAQAMDLPDEMPLIGGLSNQVLGDHPYTRRGWDQGPAYDPATAKRLLDQAGWIDSDGDGIRERDGREARFALLARRGRYPAAEALALLIQDQLQRVGVSTEIRSMAGGLARDAIRSGDFDAAISWLVDQDPLDVLEEWFGEPLPFGYYDAEAAHLLEAIGAEPDPNAQDTLYSRINEIFRRDMPVTFLFPGLENNASHRRIQGFHPNLFLHFAEELWIEEGNH